MDHGYVTTNFIRTYFISEQTTTEEVNTMLCQFWEIDSSGITNLPFVSKDEQLLLERAEKSIRFTEGHYQIALPWKQEMLQLPDNYRMALNRLALNATAHQITGYEVWVLNEQHHLEKYHYIWQKHQILLLFW